MEKLTKKYGLFTAICTVVGIVIGSGIFFKAKDVIVAAGGNALYSILAWFISGMIMVVIATTFAFLATKYEKVNGAVDYAEAMCGKKYAYFVGWFMSLIYYPAMTAVLAWVSARYTLVVFGYSEAPLAFVEGTKSTLNSPEVITLALFYLVLAFFVNAIAPRLAGKFQISATVIKLIPIVFIALVGTVVGLINGNLGANIAIGELGSANGSGGLLAAICTTVFAYDGWIVATSINSEIKDAKKNLPIALCLGTLIIVTAYTLFNVGLFGLANIGDIATGGTTVAYNFFGGAAAAIINILVVISCLGTLNGLMLGGSRGIYALSARGEGFSPETFAQVDKVTGIPHNSAIFSLMMSGGWFLYFILLGSGLFDFGVASKYAFDSSELPIVTLYAMYIPILVAMMIKEKELGVFRRFVLPSLSIVGIGVIVYACVSKHGIRNVWYLIVFAIFMAVGAFIQMKNKKEAVN